MRIQGKPTQYTGNPDLVGALVAEDAVHRDLYIEPEIFELEMRHLWPSSWIYVGHESQVPLLGDFISLEIGREPVILVRNREGGLNLLSNRCAHKGTKLVGARAGNLRSSIRCPYHGWAYHLDGGLRAIPLADGYEGTGFEDSEARLGLARFENLRSYRGFVFARLAGCGLSFEEYFGESLSSIDYMVDRSPDGRLEVAGGVLRYTHNCNWKMFLENLNDAMHPMVAHQSSAGTARDLWRSLGAPGMPKPMAVEQFEPFVSNYEFFDEMGVRVFPNGHSYTGVNFSIHSDYPEVPGYDDAMAKGHGRERAREILSVNRHNTVYYPSLTIKGPIQTIRVARPLAVDKTLVESWTFRLVGAPEELLWRTLTYSRLINAPTSVVGHDDLHCYRAIQEGLAGSPRDWINLQRGHDVSSEVSIKGVYNGTSEVSMRGQFRAWKTRMLEAMNGA